MSSMRNEQQAQRLRKWLTDQYLKWQMQEGERRTISQFADYLSIARVTLDKWLRGERMPGGEFVGKLADKLGDEIYDIMGLQRPDPRLRRLLAAWTNLSDDQRAELEQIELADLLGQYHNFREIYELMNGLDASQRALIISAIHDVRDRRVSNTKPPPKQAKTRRK